MSKILSALASARIDECYDTLYNMTDRNLFESIQAHFASHPALPGEKSLRENVNKMLEQLNLQHHEDGSACQWFDGWNEWESSGITRQSVTRKFAETQIRETSLNEDFRQVDISSLVHSPVNDLQIDNVNVYQYVDEQSHYKEDVYVGRINAILTNEDDGKVHVLAQHTAGGYLDIGTLPDSFVKNNPLLNTGCSAEVEFADFSNGKFKNLSGKVVVNTDKMTGDLHDDFEQAVDNMKDTYLCVDPTQKSALIDDDFTQAVNSISMDAESGIEA